MNMNESIVYDHFEANETHIISDETMQINDQNSKNLSSITETINVVNPDRIKQSESNELWNEYWNLLKSSKSKVKDTKDSVDTLLGVCNKWNDILTLKNKGTTLSEDQKEFMTDYVEDEFKEYFLNDFYLSPANMQWQDLNRKVDDRYAMLARTAEQKAIILGKQEKLSIKKKVHKFSTVVGGVVGTGITYSVFGTPAGLLTLGVTAGASYWYHKKAGKETTQLERELEVLSFPETENKESVYDMKSLSEMKEDVQPSFKTVQPVFADLKEKMKNEKSDGFFKPLQGEVVKIIDSSQRLQIQCQDLIQQIGSAQKSAH